MPLREIRGYEIRVRPSNVVPRRGIRGCKICVQLKEAGNTTDIFNPQPLHLTRPCRELGYQESDFSITEKASLETLAILIYPEIGQDQVDAMVESI